MTNQTILHAVKTLKYFVSNQQLQVLADGCRGEERQWFKDKILEIHDIVTNMPKIYETDGQGDEAIVHLHYFNSNMDFYITERDISNEQYQAFGLAVAPFEELGYISIDELIDNGFELDLHFEPKSLGEIKKELK